MVWISERAERRKPSLSASRIATSDTSGRVEPLAQQVDSDQHVEIALAQAADDLDALDRLDIRVQVAHAHAEVLVVVGQVLGHLLGQAGHQHALVDRDPFADLVEQVVDLGAGLAHLDFGIDKPGGPDQLLDHQPAGLLAARNRRASPKRRPPA